MTATLDELLEEVLTDTEREELTLFAQRLRKVESADHVSAEQLYHNERLAELEAQIFSEEAQDLVALWVAEHRRKRDLCNAEIQRRIKIGAFPPSGPVVLDFGTVKQQIKDKTVDLIAAYVSLKKSGQNQKALCPFHAEKKASFIVYTKTLSWRCFGACATGGDIFDFYMRLKHCDFPTALRELAQEAGVELPKWRNNGNHSSPKISPAPSIQSSPPNTGAPQATPSPAPANWADLEACVTPICWEWRAWLAQALLHLLVSESGQGKSALALRIAACFLRGDSWPDGTPFTGEIGSVLWCEAEAAQAINLARAKAWGLPLDKILTPFDDPLVDILLDSPKHKAAIADRIRLPDVRLTVVDSLRGAHRGDENSSNTSGIAKWLAEQARDAGKPVLLTHHLRKRGPLDGTTGISLDRLRGSTAIVQMTRLVWAIDVPDPNHPTDKRLSVIKSNVASFPEPLGLRIEGNGIQFGQAPKASQEVKRIKGVADQLQVMLQRAPRPAREVQAEVEQAGFSWNAAKRMKRKLGIVSVKKDGIWFWSLPLKGGD